MNSQDEFLTIRNYAKSLSENEIELEKAKIAAKGIEEQSLEKYQIEISTYQIPENINTNQLNKDIKSLRSKIEVFGPINMMASQEFNDLTQRKEFIDQQKGEVLTSIETLEKASLSIPLCGTLACNLMMFIL